MAPSNVESRCGIPAAAAGAAHVICPDGGQSPDLVPQKVGTSSSSLAQPTATHRYEAIKTLYRNRLSKVCLCKDDKGTKVIMKRYLVSQLSAHEQVNVMREVKFTMSTAITSHPNIVKGIAAFRDATSICLVQEFGAMGDLYDVANRFPHRQLPESVVLDKILRPITQAIEFLHSKGIMHRDIKPENIIVMADGTSKLCDFGLAINTNDDCPVSCVGTLEYMAPELVRLKPAEEEELEELRRKRAAQYTNKVDVWALGCLAFELLVGHSPFLPFKGAPEDRLEAAILAGVIQVGRGSCLPAVTRECLQFMRSALRIDPRQRPTALALLQSEWLCSAPSPANRAAQHFAAGASALPASAGSGMYFCRPVTEPSEALEIHRSDSVPALLRRQQLRTAAYDPSPSISPLLGRAAAAAKGSAEALAEALAPSSPPPRPPPQVRPPLPGGAQHMGAVITKSSSVGSNIRGLLTTSSCKSASEDGLLPTREGAARIGNALARAAAAGAAAAAAKESKEAPPSTWPHSAAGPPHPKASLLAGAIKRLSLAERLALAEGTGGHRQVLDAAGAPRRAVTMPRDHRSEPAARAPAGGRQRRRHTISLAWVARARSKVQALLLSAAPVGPRARLPQAL